MSHWRPALASVLVLAAGGPARGADPVSLESLLAEMVDRDAIARFPEPAYTALQFSSYDRASATPDDPEGWFANGDWGKHLRSEERSGRREWVMMDAEGPGAVVRIWSANPKGTLRVYLDGDAKPVVEAPMADVLGGRWLAGAPLAAVRARGHNLYLPIPYRAHCVITADAPDFYYQINYRTYAPGTDVRTLTAAELKAANRAIDETCRALATDREIPIEGNFPTSRRVVEPGGALDLDLPAGPKAVRSLRVDVPGHEPMEALRHIVVTATFDGVQTIWCPLGDFFGAGAGAEGASDWYRWFGEGRGWACRWTMPYEKTGRIGILNLGSTPIELSALCVPNPWTWDDRSMHFHARWRFEHPVPTRPMRDWNYLEVTGQGVYAGDTLAVVNPAMEWWGEGDEKIYVDGQSFPSHFGTGTEDYYGYAWGSTERFEGPFHSQSRADGYERGVCWGHTTVSRVRLLDAIPFHESLRFDMEVWHWADCDLALAATTFFYARPGAVHNRPPRPEAAAAPVPQPPPLPPPYRVPGAVECESMKVRGKSRDLRFEPQVMRSFGREVSSDEHQLFVQARAPGDFIELRVPAEGSGPRRLLLYATRSWDYGIVRFSVNGRRAGGDVDLFNEAARAVAPTGPIDLGVFDPVGGAFVLRVEVAGGNPRSEGTRSFFGLDCVVLAPP